MPARERERFLLPDCDGLLHHDVLAELNLAVLVRWFNRGFDDPQNLSFPATLKEIIPLFHTFSTLATIFHRGLRLDLKSYQ